MTRFLAYWQLTRLNKPIGILLLWYPTAWALWMANAGVPALRLLLIFSLGTVLMRTAGCIINDLTDRDIDQHVDRTKHRPLATGAVSIGGAMIVLAILLASSLLLLVYLPWACWYWALLALVVTVIYPWCKRLIATPQLVLGLAFSMSIPMAYAASGIALNNDTILLWLINFFWIIAYDTMYAMTDRADDLKIGVNSTAIFFGDYDRTVIGLLQSIVHGLWCYWAIKSDAHLGFYSLWALAGGVLLYQQYLIHRRIPRECFKAFLISGYYGGLMWIALAVQGNHLS